ncbi:MAG TPA: ImmA/IrrE family metallo-endopeptidase [Fimbriimonadaceae bacterium]|nr:ImmA/IrrE family metallo-endopeptidase [Fimbriimonadaceae bacterium]
MSTSDLTTLLEEYVSELDLYADLSDYGDVEGATFFAKGGKPVVKISAALSEAPNENRLRSTLAHEFGHVFLHDPMFQRRAQQGSFEEESPVLQVSFRDGFSSSTDLFEHQAWCVCGALLMPIGELSRIVGGMAAAANHYSDIYLYSDLGLRIHAFVAKHFGVSKDLAGVRLLRAKVVTDQQPRPALF